MKRRSAFAVFSLVVFSSLCAYAGECPLGPIINGLTCDVGDIQIKWDGSYGDISLVEAGVIDPPSYLPQWPFAVILGFGGIGGTASWEAGLHFSYHLLEDHQMTYVNANIHGIARDGKLSAQVYVEPDGTAWPCAGRAGGEFNSYGNDGYYEWWNQAFELTSGCPINRKGDIFAEADGLVWLDGGDVHLDELELTIMTDKIPVPEPCSILLLSSGLAVCFMRAFVLHHAWWAVRP